MGNVNAREEEEEANSNHHNDNDAEIRSHQAPDFTPSEQLMGGHHHQSPPHSPRATQSPLMFAPQVPVIPLQRPDEIHIPNPSWMMQSPYEEASNEQGIPTMITWCHGGKEISVEGSWDNWKSRSRLQRSGKDFTIMKVLPSGVYEYRFIVDGQWMHAPELPFARDDAGNTFNLLDLQDYVPEDIQSISGFEPPQSPEASYSSLLLGAEDYSKEPPLVPPHLQMTLLNLPPANPDVPSPLPRPQHVVLNHLYMQKGKSGPSVVALGSTNRFLANKVVIVEERRKGGGYIIPPWILKETNMPPQDEEEVFRWDDEEEGAEGEVGDAPGTGKFTCNEDEEKEKERRQRYRQRLRLLAKRRKANGSTIDHIE